MINKTTLLFSALPLILSCVSGYYVYEGNSKIHSNSACEIRIAYNSLDKDHLRIYFVPKNEYICGGKIINLKAILFVNNYNPDSSQTLTFISKSDSSDYTSYFMDMKYVVKDKNDIFRTYCPNDPDAWPLGNREKYSYCMVNLFSIDTNKVTINKDDMVGYNINGKIRLYSGQIINIDKNDIMQKGKFSGR